MPAFFSSLDWVRLESRGWWGANVYNDRERPRNNGCDLVGQTAYIDGEPYMIRDVERYLLATPTIPEGELITLWVHESTPTA